MRDLADVVQGLSAVGPDDLPPLLTRTDRKYVVPVATLSGVLDSVGASVAALDVGGSRAFRYLSLYMDTPDKRSFHSSAHGRRGRFKVRIRDYVDRSERVLEVKTAGRRGMIVKDRLVLEPHELAVGAPVAVSGCGGSGARPAMFTTGTRGATFVDLIVGPGVATSLGPAVWTWYERSTLVDRDGGHRITIDTTVAGCAPDGDPFLLVRTGLAIVETKSSGSVSSFDRALWRHGHRPCRISKFGVAMALSHPDLPRNRWHPIITRSSPGSPDVAHSGV